ncbi:hypothetical protein BS78_05G145600 [Paspalum vaginatum]|nr:hypothetical protein BS78_05G145600 [Paspalum vaginatum]
MKGEQRRRLSRPGTVGAKVLVPREPMQIEIRGRRQTEPRRSPHRTHISHVTTAATATATEENEERQRARALRCGWQWVGTSGWDRTIEEVEGSRRVTWG